ncbi:MAG: hypothetical protein MCS20_02020, partial [Candidatus Phytoplasma mali]|nr:hypothetical protein [Candidatus Phytoplasma mali]MCZ8632785.1 hypothetical protein [Spiroplasma sp. Tabriz.8]
MSSGSSNYVTFTKSFPLSARVGHEIDIGEKLNIYIYIYIYIDDSVRHLIVSKNLRPYSSKSTLTIIL